MMGLIGIGEALLVLWDKDCGIEFDFVGKVVVLLASRK